MPRTGRHWPAAVRRTDVMRSGMSAPDVGIRDLRLHGGDVVDRVAAGECVTVTRAGKPVAELRPVGRPAAKAEVLLERWRGLPPLDPVRVREDLDELLAPTR